MQKTLPAAHSLHSPPTWSSYARHTDELALIPSQNKQKSIQDKKLEAKRGPSYNNKGNGRGGLDRGEREMCIFTRWTQLEGIELRGAGPSADPLWEYQHTSHSDYYYDLYWAEPRTQVSGGTKGKKTTRWEFHSNLEFQEKNS